MAMEDRFNRATGLLRQAGQRAVSAAGAARASQSTISRLKAENKRLRRELKTRGFAAAAPAQPVSVPADDDRRAMVEAFHCLYRDGLRLDKQTWWRGARVIKCPLDLWVYQELIFELKPDLIIETGTMYGGSAYYLASICDMAGTGEILTIDKNQREGRPQHERITYALGSSTAADVVAQARGRAEGKSTVMVLLDSNHKAEHVLGELRAYHPLVTPGSYLVVEDTNINGHPVEPTFGPGPTEALQAFLRENDDFELDAAREKFLLTFNPDGWLRKKTT